MNQLITWGIATIIIGYSVYVLIKSIKRKQNNGCGGCNGCSGCDQFTDKK